MSRIRSIHPGLWTDDAFMGLSAHARLLYIGLWNEAFDDGVFEWKPRTIKARIFPADNLDVEQLLAELVAADCIREGSGTGRMHGLIRNFRVYQRPKKPNSSGMLQPEDREYVGLVPNQSGTDTEEAEQMEDGGGKVEEESKPSASPAKGTRWQKGRKVPDEWKAWSRARFPSVELYRLTTETRNFEEYWPGQVGKAGVKGDWEATYHVWMRNKFGDFEVDDGATPAADLVVIRPGDEDFEAIKRKRGKPPMIGQNGSATVTRAELEEAKLAVH